MEPFGTNPLGIARLGVALGERTYSIAIGSQLLSGISDWLQRERVSLTHAVCIADEQVSQSYAQPLQQALVKAGVRVSEILVPSGEKSKSAAELARIWDALLQAGTDRQSVVFAIGGGVVGDLAGMAASTYARGLRWIQIPTTLLAQVDSSVGGKTGINLEHAKNMAGTFWQPSLVLIDVDTLHSLPEREFVSGLAEVVKYGVIMDAPFFEWLEQHVDKILARFPEIIRDLIFRSCRCKAMIVTEDERETGTRRAILNYGHTYGHAIEAVAGYGQYLHGEAVAIGMTCAARLAATLGYCESGLLIRQTRLLTALSLPTVVGNLSPEELLNAMRTDKKNRDGQFRLILPTRIGEVQSSVALPKDIVASLQA